MLGLVHVVNASAQAQFWQPRQVFAASDVATSLPWQYSTKCHLSVLHAMVCKAASDLQGFILHSCRGSCTCIHPRPYLCCQARTPDSAAHVKHILQLKCLYLQ